MKKSFQQLVDLADQNNSLGAAWYRQILTIASGGLALLVGLRPAIPPEGIARYLLAAAWLFLGLGIVFGGGATYLEVNRARKLKENFRKELHQFLRSGIPMTGPVSTGPDKIFLLCRPLMIFSLIFAVICLVGYSILLTLKS